MRRDSARPGWCLGGPGTCGPRVTPKCAPATGEQPWTATAARRPDPDSRAGDRSRGPQCSLGGLDSVTRSRGRSLGASQHRLASDVRSDSEPPRIPTPSFTTRCWNVVHRDTEFTPSHPLEGRWKAGKWVF
ncbi:hypothetical protein MTO96_005177 [Rhipicephalus appendiculatus]